MITYKKARKLTDLLVDVRETQVMIGHRENLSNGILCLSVPDFDAMTGRQVIKTFNAYIDSLLEHIATERPVEIENGQPQLKWSRDCRQWTAAGHVLRCVVDWDREAGEQPGQVAIRIDDKLLSSKEFLSVIASFEGWGMRIEFMHENRLIDRPEPIVKKTGRNQMNACDSIADQ